MVRLQLLRHPAGLHPHGRARGEELVEDARLGETNIGLGDMEEEWECGIWEKRG